MELDKVKELVEMMKANELSELEIVDGQTRIVLKRGPGQVVPQVIAMAPTLASNGANSVSVAPPAAVSPASANEPKKEPGAETIEEDKLIPIVAPIVGTLYTAPSRSADPFLEVGAKVEEETVVCIIEAMKVMNEIKSDVRGTVKKILIENGSAVEYGQRLFLVEPD
jgi:acetyl-CoA carboxylase biotin carboxyl carrier protein